MQAPRSIQVPREKLLWMSWRGVSVVRILGEWEVKRDSTSVMATRGGVWEPWVRGLDFRLGSRLENSIAFTEE